MTASRFKEQRWFDDMRRWRSALLLSVPLPCYVGSPALTIPSTSTGIGTMNRHRLLPHRGFPDYAYLPGRLSHPVRDPAGHSYGVQGVQPVFADLHSEEFTWGCELFNHGYYWEAHEAWEGIWQVAERGSPLRSFLKALILLSAAGVKSREGKRPAAMRHAGRAAGLLRQLPKSPGDRFSRALAVEPSTMADVAQATAAAPPILQVTELGRPEPVFRFIIGGHQSVEAGVPAHGSTSLQP